MKELKISFEQDRVVKKTKYYQTLNIILSVACRMKLIATSRWCIKAHFTYMRLRAHDHFISSTLIGGTCGAAVQVRFPLGLRDQWSMWMQDGCKSLHGFLHDPWPLRFKHSHWWQRWGRSEFASHQAWETNGVCECKMDVKSTWIPTWHRMDHVSRSLGLFFKNRLLEVGLTQNHRETMALWNPTAVDLFYYIMCEDLHE